MATNDPVVRYAAIAVLLAAFFSGLAVTMHGYWSSSTYSPPPFVVSILASGMLAAAGALGLHIGSTTTITGVDTGVKAASTGSNGHREGA